MDKLNTYFVPLDKTMLPEYLSSGFIGLTSSIEPDSDIQSLSFPKVSVLESIDEIAHDLCLEITSIKTAIKAKKKTFKYLMLDGPIAISNIKKIIFFDQQSKDNFIASFSMLPDLPVDLFEFEVQEKTNKLKPSRVKPPVSKITQRALNVNHQTSLNIAVVNLYKKLNIDFNYSSKNEDSTPFEICYELITKVLNELPLTKEIHEYEFQLLRLYIFSLKKLGMTENGELINIKFSSQEIIKEMALHASIEEPIRLITHEENINLIIPRILDKTQNILIGIESPSELSDKDRVLQRSIFLACVSDNLDALEHQIKSLNAGNIVAAIAEFLTLFRDKTNYLSGDLWRKNREELDQYLLLSENIASSEYYSVISSIEQNSNDFGSQSNLLINQNEIASKEIKPDPELMIVVERLKSFKFNPKPGPNESIHINVLKNDFKVPITLSILPCSVTKEKRNLILSALIPNISNLIDKKSTRNQLLEITHHHMVSIGIIDQNLEISRYQLADTLDRDELQHHIELISAAYTELINKFSHM